MKSVLIVQTAFIGDVILSTPMFATFKRFFPETRLAVLVKPEAISLLENNPAIDELLVIDKKGAHRSLPGMLRLAAEVRRRRFDLLLSPHISHRSSLLALLSRIPERCGYRHAAFARLAYHRLLKRRDQLPEIQRLLHFLADATGRSLPEERLPIDPSTPSGSEIDRPLLYENRESQQEAKRVFSNHGIKEPILLGVSSVWATKRWTPYGFARLAALLSERYRRPILLIGSKGDREVSRAVMAFVADLLPERSASRIHDICGETSLPGLYSLMLRSKVLISNDSAPVHIGCAANLPVVAIFGPTTPELGYAPYFSNTRIASIDLPCRPCGTHGANSCPEEHFRCMRDLTEEMVAERVAELIGPDR